MSQKPFLRVKRALGGFVAPPVGLVEGGGGVEQGEVAKTRPKRGAQGAWPVSSGHGSCQGAQLPVLARTTLLRKARMNFPYFLVYHQGHASLWGWVRRVCGCGRRCQRCACGCGSQAPAQCCTARVMWACYLAALPGPAWTCAHIGNSRAFSRSTRWYARAQGCESFNRNRERRAKLTQAAMRTRCRPAACINRLDSG